jgi:DNA-binding beta-propeller fold protein YncE
MVLRALILVLVACAAGAGDAPAGTAGGAEEAYVAVGDENLVVAVLLDAGKVTARIRVPRGPRSVTVTGDARFILVTSPAAGKVTMIDAFTHRVIKIFGGFGRPHDVEIAGRYAYVTDEARGQLAVLDVKARRLVSKVAIGARPNALAVGDFAWVTHGPHSSLLTGVDLSDPQHPRVFDRFDAGGLARGITRRPDSENVYLAFWRSGDVAAFSTFRRRALWRRSVGAWVSHVVFDYYDGQRLWLTDRETGEVLAVRSRDGRVARRLRNCPGARDVHFGPGRGHIVATCHDAGTLLVLDPVAERRTNVKVGRGPHGVAVAFVP